ncbi:MAG: helix-turn-helix domain-containing protein [Caldilinea sp. CFX5]|nr:helix-turn-helix domain-containing protein [Caldilinea sp. CFX5]
MSRSAAVKLDVIATITTFGDLLRYLRQRAHLTQRDLALAVGYSISQISRLEHNERLPDELTLLSVFVPALGLEHEPATVERLLALARQARGEVESRPALPATSDEAVRVDPVTPQPAPRLTNLPQRLTSFIGREQAVMTLQRLVKENRLVTLTGVGGVGKSSLALAVAETLAFPDSVWLLELAPITEGGLVARRLADLFHLPETPEQTALEAVTIYLQHKELLLIVDNCEHLIATCAEIVDRLLQAAANLHILATSREALNIAGEHEWPVVPLATPTHAPSEGAAWSMRQLQPFAAVQLFSERAQAINADLRFTDQDAPLLAHLCRQLDGIPLALELAAARCKSLTLTEIVARLNDRFSLLSAGRRTALLRHQTLRATVDWSYDLLSPAEAALFRSLAVFAGGWTLAAAEQVAPPGQRQPPTFDLLHQLVNKSLVVVDQRGETTRYRMLETIREYAHEKLVEQGEEAAVREQHAVYFLQLAEQVRPLLYSAEQQVWYQRLIEEQNNFRAAVQWARANQHYVLVARFGASLCWFWTKHGEMREEMPRLEWALAAIDHHNATTPPAIRAKALYSVGTGAAWSGDFVRARQLFEECLQVEEEPNAWFELSEVLGSLADIVEWEGDYAHATALIERYLALSRAHNFMQGVADALTSLGELVRLQGDYVRARQLLQESLDLRKAVGTLLGVASTQGYLGIATRELGDFLEAQRLQEEALQLATTLDDKMLIAGITTELGVLAHLLHDYEKAEHLQQRALTLLTELDFQAYVALALSRLGSLALSQGDGGTAYNYYVESLIIAQRIATKRSLAASLEGLAAVAIQNGQPHQASHLLGAADACRQSIGISRPIEERILYAQAIAVARATLGEAQFEAAYRTGQAATLHDVLTVFTQSPAYGL